MRRAFACVVCALALGGCSLVRDFSVFRASDGSVASDGGAQLDAGPRDASVDGADTGVVTDAGVGDAGPRDIVGRAYVRIGGMQSLVIALDADRLGNLYALVAHPSPLTLGGQMLPVGSGGLGHAIVSYSPDLQLRWVVPIESAADAGATLKSLRVTPLGLVYAVGSCVGRPDLGGGMRLWDCGMGSALITSYTPDGALRPSVVTVTATLNATGRAEYTSLAMRSDDEPIAVGGRYTQAGSAMLTRNVTGQTSHPLCIGSLYAVDGAVESGLVVGSLAATCSFTAMQQLYLNDEFDQPFFVRTNASGTVLARTYGGVKAGFTGAVLRGDGGAIVQGQPYDGNTVRIGTAELTAGFLVRLDERGDVVTRIAQRLPEPRGMRGFGARVISLWGTGLAGDDFGGGPAPRPSASTLAWHTPDGAFVASAPLGWGALDVVVTAQGRTYVAGSFKDAVELTPGGIVSTPGTEGVIVELSGAP